MLAWAVERPDGGRGFGFTGGHFHINWGDDYFRKLILNALVWAATTGTFHPMVCPPPSNAQELKNNLDPKKGEEVRRIGRRWHNLLKVRRDRTTRGDRRSRSC